MIVEPSWENPEGASAALTGAAASFTGPAGATYTLADASASYGSPAAGTPASCFEAGGNCYRLTITNPATRPAAHWDAAVTETVDATAAKTWTLHVGGSFADVAPTDAFYPAVENLFHQGVTAGCSGANFCPSSPVTRAQMSVFLLKSRYGRAYAPPDASGAVFADVPAGAFAAAWIEDLAESGIAAGCGSGLFCPGNPVTRSQMAVFLLKTEHGSAWVPPPASGLFADVPVSSPFAPWIERLYAEGVTAGCGGGNYCPNNPNTRGQMAVFLTKTFALKLYGP